MFVGLVASSLAIIFCGCRLIEGPNPIKIVGAQIVIGADAVSSSQFVSMHYTLQSAASQSIAAVHISFYMYDTSGDPVPSGNNYFDVTFEATIAPGSQISGATSLDSAFYYKPPVDLIANQFHIYRVDFSDGSSWTDWLGEYVYPYNVTSAAGS